ncbi:hypothetical protein QTN25_000224 [Entamoeba marina]
MLLHKNYHIKKQLDSYSILICSKYFIGPKDFINLICVNSKFKETTEKLRFNPIPITSLKLFPKIQTQYLYQENNTKINGIENYEIWYDVTYKDCLNFQKNGIKCHHIAYTKTFRSYDSIPISINIINDYCFEDAYFNTITIPSIVTSLKNYSFTNCWNLEYISLPACLTTISTGCFSNCASLTNIIIPSSIHSLNDYCFSDCSNLSTIKLPDTITSIGIGCFSNCYSLQSIILPPLIHMLKNETFNNCSSLINIELPSSLISIGGYCFYGCSSLRKIKLPTLLKQIGNDCFSFCSIESIETPRSVKLMDISYFLEYFTLSDFENNITNNTFTFKVSYYDSILYKQYGINCNNIVLTKNDVSSLIDEMLRENHTKNFIIPIGILKLGNDSFAQQNSIESILIPTTVTSIGDDCFNGCLSLTTLNIPSSVKLIGIGCFRGCENLKTILLPPSYNNKYPFKVSYEEFATLKKCGITTNKLEFNITDYIKFNKTIPTSVPLILNVYKTNEIIISNNIISLKSNHLSINITSITIPTSVTKLCNDCFKKYIQLQSITIPTTIKYIGKHLIDGCISLTQLNYEGNWNDIVVSYDDHLRYESKGLLFNNIEYTKDDKIKYGNVIPSIVHSLQRSYYERSSEVFYIPKHITSLDNNMFEHIFDNYSQLQNIIIPTSIKTIPKYCFRGCITLTYVSLPSTLTVIKKKAFSNCISLESITIPPHVISVKEYAFEYCHSLTSITFPTSVIMGNDCFKGCGQLKDIIKI